MIATGQAPKTSGSAAEKLSTLNKLTLSDNRMYGQTLYLGREGSLSLPLSFFEIPPFVPEGVFTASFRSGRMAQLYPTDLEKAARQSYVIELKSASYPITLAWEPQSGENNNPIGILVSDGAGGKFFTETVLDKRGTLKITNSNVKRL